MREIPRKTHNNRFSFVPPEHRQKVLFDKNAIWHANLSARKTPAAVIFVADTHSYGVLGTQTFVYTNLLVNPASLLPALSRRHPRRAQSGVSLHQRAVIPNL